VDYIHVGLRDFFVNNDKKLSAIRRGYYAKFSLYLGRATDYFYPCLIAWLGGIKIARTT